MDFKKNPETDFKDVKDLSKKEAEKQAEALREGIAYHDYRYYVKNKPEISDATYDALFERLMELEKEYPEVETENSPTKRVGAEPADELRKIPHTAPLLSLNAVVEEDEVEDFDDFIRHRTNGEKVRYVVEPKFDGLSVEIIYEEGVFTRGSTRGDGETGEEISMNLRTIGAIPLKLRHTEGGFPEFLSVRGEIFMTRSGFQELNKKRIEENEEPFANPRNAAAGTMRQLDPRDVRDKPLDIMFYEILKIDGTGFETHWEKLRRLPEWGLKTDNNNTRCDSIQKVKEYHRRMAEKRDDLEYEIDGIVIKVDDLALREKLGTRQRSPRWALAWKFPPKKEVTRLKEIVVQVGRTGMLTPVALLDPVDIGGVTVSRATLHNEDEVKKKDVRSGDKVRIERAGDVIPEVVERVKERGKKRSEPFSMPGKCPVCGAKIYREGAYNYCQAGLACRAQLVGHIMHYASRDAMNIEGLGEKIIRRMVDGEMLHDVADLYELDKGDLLECEGFAEKSADNLFKAIQESREARLDRFLYALGIRHVGIHVARVLAREFGSLEKIGKAGKKQLEEINEIGPEIAGSVAEFFDRERNKKVLKKLRKHGVEVKDMPGRKKKQAFKDKTFVFTGSMEHFTREEAKEIVEMRGGRATSSVSGETDCLVVGEEPGSKLDDAKKENVEIIDEKEFEKMVDK